MSSFGVVFVGLLANEVEGDGKGHNIGTNLVEPTQLDKMIRIQ